MMTDSVIKMYFLIFTWFSTHCFWGYEPTHALIATSTTDERRFPKNDDSRLAEHGKVAKCTGRVPVEGYSINAACFQPRFVDCDGSKTLLESYTPIAKVAGDNPPDTKFFLFTLQNPIHPENVAECGGKLPKNTNFNRSYPTELFIHGSKIGACGQLWMRKMRDQLFMRRKGEYNVFLIDWSWSTIQGNRSLDVQNVPVVAEQIAYVINKIMDQTESNGSKFHFVGHSLGAHVAGIAGKLIPSLRRITGLDPSERPFIELPPQKRLTRWDADLVDIIHTSVFDGGIGFKTPLGDVDFFPNGGKKQPINAVEVMRSISELDLATAFIQLNSTIYNHLLAIYYYMSSINPCGCEFVSVECSDYESFEQGICDSCGGDGNNCAVMGMDLELYNYKQDGRYHKYYLNTDAICPYCNNKGIEFDGFSLKDESLFCNNPENVARSGYLSLK